MTGLAWAAIICGAIVFGPLFGHLVWALLTGPKQSAAEVARAQQMDATPAHPAGKAIPETAPFDAEEWVRQYAAAHAPELRRDLP